MTLVDRFLHYVSFDTQSDELTNMTPSTPGQMIFAKALEKELRRFGAIGDNTRREWLSYGYIACQYR